jgi:hypothetical protein
VRINVYIDGFNLYYGSLKGRPYKWLNLETMSGLLLRRFDVQRIRYFTAHVKERPGNLQARGRRTVEVIKTEEKGSDVNLATYLLVDAFRDDAEAFAVVSNDSDLTEPIRIVRHELGKVVGLLNPQPVPSQRLLRCRPTFAKQIRPGVLGASQFPQTVVVDASGSVVHKPRDW